jgi:hypothetical protein
LLYEFELGSKKARIASAVALEEIEWQPTAPGQRPGPAGRADEAFRPFFKCLPARDRERVARLFAEAAHGAFHPCVAKEKLHRFKIPGLAVDQRRLYAAQRKSRMFARAGMTRLKHSE